MNIEQRRARREQRRRAQARKRARGLAVIVLLAMAALIVAVLIATGALSSSHSGSLDASARTHTRGTASGTGSSGKAGSRSQRPAGGGGSGGGGSAAGSSQNAARGPSAPRDVSVPILMYHVINPPPAGAKFPGLYVSRSELKAQVRALAQAGFHAVTMDQMLAHWLKGAWLPAKPIVLSFDNGYQSQYSNALPVLRSVGWVGVENIQLTGLPPSQGGMSQAQVRGLLAAGWELDTQGFSHADLITLSPSELHYQVAVARREVARRYGVPVNWFCYPSGHYNATVIAEVRAAGYVGSTTVVPGWAGPSEDPYRLPRLRVLGGTSPSALLAQIAAARSASAPPLSYP